VLKWNYEGSKVNKKTSLGEVRKEILLKVRKVVVAIMVLLCGSECWDLTERQEGNTGAV